MDYIGLAKAYFLEYETKRFIEQTVTVPLGRGCNLPETADRDVVFESKAMTISFLDEEGDTRVRVQSPAFGGTTLSAELLVERPKGHETLSVVIPWSEHRFNFTSKQNCLPATGSSPSAMRRFPLIRGKPSPAWTLAGAFGPIRPSGTGLLAPACRMAEPLG